MVTLGDFRVRWDDFVRGTKGRRSLVSRFTPPPGISTHKHRCPPSHPTTPCLVTMRYPRLLVTVAVAAAVAALASARVITFTGNATTDFVGTDVFMALDSTTDLQWVAGASIQQTGWNIHDIRYHYDVDTDTAFFGGFGWEGYGEGCSECVGMRISKCA